MDRYYLLFINIFIYLFNLIILTIILCIKTLLIATIKILEQNTMLNLALIQWYDFKKDPYYQGCPRLKLIDNFNFIDVESIQDIVHIIPRFNSNNEYLVNKFIF